MQRYKIELDTMNDIRRFINIVSALPGEIRLVDGHGMCVNGKSILGAIATMEWSSLYCLSETEIGEHIAYFCREDDMVDDLK